MHVYSVILKRFGHGPARLRLHTALAPVARRLPGNQPKPKNSRRYASRSCFSTFSTQPSRTRMTHRALGTAGDSGALEACWSSRSLSEEERAGFNLARGLYACPGSGSGSGSGVCLSRCSYVVRIVAGYCCAARERRIYGPRYLRSSAAALQGLAQQQRQQQRPSWFSVLMRPRCGLLSSPCCMPLGPWTVPSGASPYSRSTEDRVVRKASHRSCRPGRSTAIWLAHR